MISQLLKRLLYRNNKVEEAERIRSEIKTQVRQTTNIINDFNTQIRETTAYKIGRATGRIE